MRRLPAIAALVCVVGVVVPLLAGTLAGCGEDTPAAELPDLSGRDLEPSVRMRLDALSHAVEDNPTGDTLHALGRSLVAHLLYDEAEVVLLQAAERGGDSVFESLHLAAIAATFDDQDRALDHFRRALAHRHDYGPTHVKCGLLLEQMERLPEARKHYERALELGPSSHALLGLGRIALAQEQIDAAVQLLERARGLSPGHPEVSAALSRAYAARGWDDRARAVATEVGGIDQATPIEDPLMNEVRLESVSYGGHLQRASSLAGSGRTNEALAVLSSAIDMFPERPEAYLEAGSLLRSVGDLEQAIVAFADAEQANPGNAEVLARKGSVLMELGRVDEAEAALLAAHAADSNHRLARTELATFLATRDPAEAEELARGLVREAPADARPRLILAVILRDRGALDEARAELRTILRTQPRHVPARELLELLTTGTPGSD